MTLSAVVDALALAAAIQERHPFVYCWPCLAAVLGAEEANIRDTAQILVLRQRKRFVLRLRICVGCGAADQWLVFTEAGT